MGNYKTYSKFGARQKVIFLVIFHKPFVKLNRVLRGVSFTICCSTENDDRMVRALKVVLKEIRYSSFYRGQVTYGIVFFNIHGFRMESVEFSFVGQAGRKIFGCSCLGIVKDGHIGSVELFLMSVVSDVKASSQALLTLSFCSDSFFLLLPEVPVVKGTYSSISGILPISLDFLK